MKERKKEKGKRKREKRKEQRKQQTLIIVKEGKTRKGMKADN